MSERDIFLAILDLPDADARAAYLDRVCGDDTSLRARVESLIDSHEEAGSFLDLPSLAQGEAPTEAHDGSSDEDSADALSFLAASERPDSLGRLGHYEVLEVLGKGGFGIVFRAFDDVLQRVVAVKVLSPQMAATSPARKRFLREARASAAVRHENVVQVHEIGEQPLPFLVMEFVPGETLQQRLDRTGPLEPGEVLRLGRQLAEGLAAAHERGLIHRDIKPSNLLIESGPQRTVKITDFGLARAADDASLTRSGVVAGTPMYMAPEQARGETLDQRADLFSLGSVLYVMLTGRPPFRATGTMGVLKRVCDDTPRPIRELIPEAPEWLCRIVEKLHAKSPAERYQSARQVADVLADCEAQVTTHGVLRDESRIPGEKPAPRRARRALIGSFVTAMLLLLVVGLWFRSGTLRYLDNRVDVVFVLDADVADVSLLRADGTVVLVDPRTQPVRLSPGMYWVQVICKPGRVVKHWETTTEGAFSLEPFPGASRMFGSPRFGFNAERGDRRIIRPVIGEAEVTGKETPSDDGWVQLFNGKDLSGWAPHRLQPSRWSVEDGVLVGRGPKTHLLSARGHYANFHLRVQVRIDPGSNGGVLFRCSEVHRESLPLGYEAELAFPVHSQGMRSGSLYCNPFDTKNGASIILFGAGKNLVEPDEWFTLEVIANGSQLLTRVNGQLVASVSNDEHRAGFLALQALGEGTAIRFRKIEIKELPATQLSLAPFVLLDAKGKERTFATLADAVMAAPAGATIEVRGNGPFAINGVTIERPLTIRAGVGFAPVLEHDLRDGLSRALLNPSAALGLEGLALHNALGERRRLLVNTSGPSLVAANCRFVSADGLCRAAGASRVEFVNCEFSSAWSMASAIDWTNPPSKGRLAMRNCVSPNWPLFLNTSANTIEAVEIEFDDNTFVSAYLLSCYSNGELLGDGKRPRPFRLRSANNLLQCRALFRVEIYLARIRIGDWPVERVERLAQALFDWKGEGNVVSPIAGYELWHGDGKGGVKPTVRKREEWKRVWGAGDVGGAEMAVSLLTSVLPKWRTTPAQLTPGDYRLGKDSPVVGLGKDGKNPGANIDHVGPGSAYERWKKTKEYTEWQTRTNEAMRAK